MVTRPRVAFHSDAALDALADAVVVADSANLIVYANRAAERLLGWPAEELVGLPLTTIQPPRLHEAHLAAFRRYMATRVPRIMGTPVRVPALRRDGAEVEIELTLSALEGDGVPFVVASLRDLSERVEVERQFELLRHLRASTLAGARLTGAERLDDVAQIVVDVLVDDFDAARGELWTRDTSTGELALRATRGTIGAESLERRLSPLTPDRMRDLRASLRPVMLDGDVSALVADLSGHTDGVAGVGAFPLLREDELEGVIVHFSRRPLPEDVGEVLAGFASVVSAALHEVEMRGREHAALDEAERSGVLVDTIFATAPVGLAFWDLEFRYVRINESLAAMNGLTPSEHIGRRVADVLPRLGGTVAEMLSRVVETGEPVLDLEVTGETPAEPDRLRHWLVSYFPVRSSVGMLIGVGGVVMEVTERQRALEQLAESEERFRVLVDSVKDYAIFMHDQEGRIVNWNAGAERVLGYSAEEILGQPFAKFFPPEEAAAGIPDEELRRTADEGRMETEGWRVRRDGSRFWANVVITALRNDRGEITGFSKVIRDVTERRKTEQALKFLADASSILSASLDYEQTLAQVAQLAVPELADWCSVHIINASGEVEQLALAHVDESKIALARDLQRRYPSDPNAPRGIHNVIRTGKSEHMSAVPDELLRQAARDEEHYRLIKEVGIGSYIVAPLLTRGRTLGAMTFIYDGTERSYGPRDVAILEDLARRAAAAVDNARLYRDAQEAIGVRDEFLSLASHELRTPVTILHAYTQALSRTVNRSLASQNAADTDTSTVSIDRSRLTGNIEAMDHAIARLVGLVENLLDVSRLQRGSLEINHVPTELVSLVSHVVDGFRAQQEHGRLPSTLKIDLELPDAPGIHGSWDPDRLDQVVTNLVDNAVKYSPPDGVVTVSLAVEEAPTGDTLMAHLRVCDRGIGIPAAQQAVIFQPYARASNASVRNYPGFGMGLAITREIIERLQGRIWVESGGEDTGSTFHVVLPGASLEPPPDPDA